jgi:hypothetical protein
VRVVFEGVDAGATDKAEQIEQALEDAAKATKPLNRGVERLSKELRAVQPAGIRRIVAEARQGRQEIISMVRAGQSLVGNLKNVGLAGLGLSTIVSGAREAARAIDELSQESVAAQQASKNLMIDISGARTEFKGYVDDMSLASAANQAFALGVVQTGEEFAALASGIQAKSEQLGVSSQQLLEQAVLAIGRGSAQRLDDLGIILNQTKAEKIYAESLGKTAKELTRVQKSQAFQKAAFQLIAEAGESATKEIDGFAVSVVKAKVEVENLKQGMLGFDDTAGKVRDALRGLSKEQLDRLAFGEVADDASAAGRELNEMLGEWGIGLADVRGQADKLGVSYKQLVKGARQKLVTDDEAFIEQFIADSLADRVASRSEEADEIEHTANLLAAMGEDQSVVMAAQLESLESW